MQRNDVVAHPFVTMLGHQVVVLDPNTADVRHVEAGFEGHHVAGKQELVGVAYKERRFRMSQAQPVPGTDMAAIVQRFEDIEPAGEPVWSTRMVIRGLNRLPVRARLR